MSLIAGYQCNGDTLDFSGNDRTATAVGATFTTPGKVYAQASFFDGIDDRWTLPTTGIDQDNQPFSCGGWHNFTNDAGSTEQMLGAGSSDGSYNTRFNVVFRRLVDGKIDFIISRTGLWSVRIVSDNVVTPSKDIDYHLFVTYDGSRTSGGMSIYVDGSVIPVTASGTFGVSAIAWDEWVFGVQIGPFYYMAGKQNQMLLYDEEVLAATISGLYNGGAGLYLPAGNPWNYYAQQMED